MHKIVISGYYGFNNIGDESILKSVVENLRDGIQDIEITVLSQNPQATADKFGVKAEDRMSPFRIIRSIAQAELLISGGGSLLQDVTSRKSILYYLAVIWIALFFRKKVFIYSQGIGPVNSGFNRKLMIKTLKKVDYIVVRDEGSREYLLEYGITDEKMIVTADPVIRLKKPELRRGKEILCRAGFDFNENRPVVGIAVKGNIKERDFLEEICSGIKLLTEKYNAGIVLIPFHFSEDMPITEEIESVLGKNVTCIKEKYLTEEMLSIIGNMDLLIGVRLHSLIHAAIMEVPMIGISYDPKVNSFLKSMDLKAMCSVYDFKGEYLPEEYEKVMANKEQILNKVRTHKDILIKKLNNNEVLIRQLLGEEKSDE